MRGNTVYCNHNVSLFNVTIQKFEINKNFFIISGFVASYPMIQSLLNLVKVFVLDLACVWYSVYKVNRIYIVGRIYRVYERIHV